MRTAGKLAALSSSPPVIAMRASRFFISTLKEAPSEAELVSHRLMLRAGLIRRLAGGIYSWMPLGLRVVRKVEAIVRAEGCVPATVAIVPASRSTTRTR